MLPVHYQSHQGRQTKKFADDPSTINSKFVTPVLEIDHHKHPINN